MQILKSLSREKFKEHVGTKDQCLSLLATEKWKERYSCRRCEDQSYGKGKNAYNRICPRFGFGEFPTSHTLLHKLKFGIEKAFEMVNDTSTSKKGANSI